MKDVQEVGGLDAASTTTPGPLMLMSIALTLVLTMVSTLVLTMVVT